MTVGFSEFMQSFRSGFFDAFFNSISFLGEEYMYIILLSILYFAINKKMCEYMGLALFFSFVFNNAIKGMFMIERPCYKFPDRIMELRPSEGSSFPSAHTQAFTAFVFSFAFWMKKKYLYVIAGILSVLMGLSRVYLGMHWLEDVAASLILGSVAAYMLYKFFMRHKDDQDALMKLYAGILLVFLPFLFLFDNSDIFKTYGLMVGFTLSIFLETRFVNFSMDVAIWKKVVRVVLSVVIMVLTLVVVGKIADKVAEEGTLLMLLMGTLRYGLMIFSGLGFTPFIIKKLNL